MEKFKEKNSDFQFRKSNFLSLNKENEQKKQILARLNLAKIDQIKVLYC